MTLTDYKKHIYLSISKAQRNIMKPEKSARF